MISFFSSAKYIHNVFEIKRGRERKRLQKNGKRVKVMRLRTKYDIVLLKEINS